MKNQRIGDVSRLLGLSTDTLRYYEKIGLLSDIQRSSAGVRSYSDKDISKLKFIQRAQKMNFTLAEIASLLQMRADPQHARAEIRRLTHKKLIEVEASLCELTTLRNELTLLVNLCTGNEQDCPIITGLEQDEEN